MNIISKVMNPLTLREPVRQKGGFCFAVLFLASVILYCNQVFGMPLPAALACAAVSGFVIFKWKLHHAVMQNAIAVHLVSLYTLTFSMQPPDSFRAVMSGFWILMTGFATLIFFIGVSELLFAVLLRLFGGEQHPELLLKCFVVSLALSFTVLLFLPSETYFGNRSQMQYAYLKFAPHFLLSTVIAAAAVTSLLCSLRSAWLRRFCCGISGILLCVYVQYMFMNRSLPEIGAGTVDWANMTGACIRNALIWVLLFTVPFLAEWLIRKGRGRQLAAPGVSFYLSALLGGIQFISLVILGVTAPPAAKTVGVKRPSGAEQFVVSADRNIITFILDGADQQYFEDAYAADPEAFACLHDFTYYTNTAMQYDSTVLSIPSMLTASRTLPGREITAWYEEICADAPAKEFYRRLREADYTVHAFGEFAANDYTPFQDYLDNLNDLTPDSTSIDKDMLYRSIRTLLVYRALPLCLKRFSEPVNGFGNDAVMVKTGCIIDNDVFLQDLNLRVSESGKPFFTVQHLAGLHDEGADALPMCLDILKKYFAQLKRLGAYDDALIIVTADHGEHSRPMNMPIFLIKQPHEQSDQIRYCSAPVSLTDYAATILDIMGLSQSGDEELFGKPVSAWSEDDTRTRLVFQRRTFRTDGVKDYPEDSRFFGYYFTGTKEDLRIHEEQDSPDLVLNTTLS